MPSVTLERLTDEQRDYAAANVGLASSVWTTMRRTGAARGLTAQELWSVCLTALIYTAARHDPSRGKFSTLYYWAVRRDIQEYRRKQLPRGYRRSRHIVNIPATYLCDPADMFMRSIASEERERPYDVDLVPEVLQHFTEREREFVERHYGLNGHMPQTYQEIAAQVGLTWQRVQFVVTKACARVRELYAERMAS